MGICCSCDCQAKIEPTSASTPRRLNGCASMVMRPASILEKSSTSSTSVERYSAHLRSETAMPRCCVLRLGLLQHAREADDAVERVADLVAHVGDEIGLGGVGAREFLGAAAHQRLELPVARPHLVQAEPVAAVDPAGGGEREQGCRPTACGTTAAG